MLVGRPSDPRSGRWTAGALALSVLGLASLGACAEPPSYELRWRLTQAGVDAAPLSSVEQCSQVGVSKIRVTTMLGSDVCSGAVVDVSEYPCFPVDFDGDPAVEGPTLEPGEYALLVEGLRRTGEPWVCEQDLCADPPADPAAAPCIAQASATLSVAEGSLPAVEVELLSPPECDDGVDNDGDGKVDGKDLGCVTSNPSEFAELNVTVFLTTVSFFGSPVVGPVNVGVNAIVFDIDAPDDPEGLIEHDEVKVISRYELDDSQWPFGVPVFSKELPPGDSQIDVYAANVTREPQSCSTCAELSRACDDCFVCDGAADVDACVAEQIEAAKANGTTFKCVDYGDCQACLGCQLTIEELTERISEAVPAQLGYVSRAYDFSADSFLTPIVAPARVITGLELGEGQSGQCTLDGNLGLEIEQLRWRVQDQGGAFLDSATLGLDDPAIAGIDEPDNWVAFPCPPAAVATSPLQWGGYRVEIQAMIGGATCFEFADLEPHDLAPQPSGAQNLFIQRVIDEQTNMPPLECRECMTDDDCTPKVCDQGLCVPKEFGSG